MADRGDGSITIVVDADAKQAQQELDRVQKSVQRIEEKIQKISAMRSPLAEQAREFAAELDAAKAKLYEMQAATNGSYSAAQIAAQKENVAALEAEYNRVQSRVEAYDRQLQSANYDLNAAKEKAGAFTAQITHAAQASEKVSSAFQKITSGLVSGFKGILSYASKATTSIVKGLGKGALTVLKKTGSLAVKAGKGFLSLFKSTKKTNGAFGGGLKSLLKYGLGIRSLYALFSKLRTAITDGFKNLAQFSSETNASLSSVKSALTQLKNSLATAFAPILTTVAPILTKFINMLSTAADYVARLMAALSGKTSYTRAAKVQENYAESLEGTGEAAEDASKSLAGFDEINQLTAKDTASASGGGADTSAQDMFEEVAIEPLSFDSWGEAFAAFLDTILNDGIPKLKSALTSAAEVINSFAANLAEMFTFPDVYDKVVLIGTEIANAFNDFVSLIDWGTIGTALGAGLNLVLGFLVSLIYMFDWVNLGASIAELLNNAIAQIDWYNVGKLLWAKFKIALETLAGFLLNLDMTQLAQAASQMIIGFCDSMSETIYSIDWLALGNQIAELLAGIDWNHVADSMFEAIGAAFGALTAVLWGIIEDAWDSVVEWWHDVACEDGQFTIQGLLDGIWEACKNIGKWINDHIFTPFIEGFKKAFGIASPSTVMKEQGGFIITGMLNGIMTGIQPIINLFNTLKTTIKGILDGIVTFVTGAFTGDWEKAWEGVSSLFKTIWNGIIATIEGAVNFIIDGINKLISALNTISFDFPDWVPLIGGKKFGISIPSITRVTLPRLATGAVIPPNREFMAVLGDQTSGNNIEAPEALIRKIVREETQNNNMDSLLREILSAIREGQTLECDGVAFAKVTKRALNNNSRAYGVAVRG